MTANEDRQDGARLLVRPRRQERLDQATFEAGVGLDSRDGADRGRPRFRPKVRTQRGFDANTAELSIALSSQTVACQSVRPVARGSCGRRQDISISIPPPPSSPGLSSSIEPVGTEPENSAWPSVAISLSPNGCSAEVGLNSDRADSAVPGPQGSNTAHDLRSYRCSGRKAAAADERPSHGKRRQARRSP